MDAIGILKKFAEYAEYDPNRKSFNLLSGSYILHRCCETITKINDYDPTGALGIMYAKDAFIDLMMNAKVSLHKLFSEPDYIATEKEMWDIFQSDEVKAIEQEYLSTFNSLVEKVCGRKLIGEEDEEKRTDRFLVSVNKAVDGLNKCQIDLFLKGGIVKPVTNFSTHIHVFQTLRDCLLTLEQAKDGIYLCWIDCNHTADGYFSFFLKSNGNILSINERVDEAYPGQHKNTRNGRWSEDKADQLFPYNFIFSFDKFDYKGYATQYMIDDEKLDFFNLGEEVYMPLVLAMLMLLNKFRDKDVDLPVRYVDSLLSINLIEDCKTDANLPALIENSLVAKTNKELSFTLTSEGVRKGEYAKECTDKSKNYKDRGYFPETNNILVDLYSEGFELETGALLVSNPHLKRLSSAETYSTDNDQINPEFVGSADRMKMAAYYQSRIQLARYVKDRIYEEYQSFGGIEGVKSWFTGLLNDNIDKIYARCVERAAMGDEPKGVLACLGYETNTKYPGRYGCNQLNERMYKTNSRGRLVKSEQFADRDNGCGCTIYFRFVPRSWLDIEKFFDISVPKIVKGWITNSYRYSGNSLLDATDATEAISTPFEDRARYSDKRYSYSDYYAFDFVIGFSKRGFAVQQKQFTTGTKKEEAHNGK